MAEQNSLEILVDRDIQVPAAQTPKKVVDALKRQLRRHDLSRLLRHDQSQRGLLNLLQTQSGQHRLPQGLLGQVTDACRRHGVPYSVVDRRAMVSCPAMRAQTSLSEHLEAALRRLLLHDSGVLIANDADDRVALAKEIIARRQQRCLILTASETNAKRWLGELERGLSLPKEHVGPLSRNTKKWLVVGTYAKTSQLADEALAEAYGLVVFDDLSEVDPISLMRTVRSVGARYMLGLATSTTRADGLHDPLYLVLGGVVHRLQASVQKSLELSCHYRESAFSFDYDGRAQYQALMAALATDHERNDLIAQDIAAAAATGEHCLVLSERRDHLEQLAELLPEPITRATLTSAVRPAERRAIGESFSRGEITVLLATSQIAGELNGLDRVSRLFISFPFAYAKKLERMIASVLHPAPGKEQAHVYDYDDPAITPLHRAFEKRHKLLERVQKAAAAEHRRWAQLDLNV